MACKIEGTFRAHQVPLLVDAEHPDHLQQLESWMKSYKAEELFDEHGRLIPELAELAPKGERRMGANPHANGGMLLRDLRMPDFRVHAVNVPSPGAVDGQDTLVLGKFLRDVIKLNQEQRNFRIFGPDETLSNRLGAVFEVTNRQWDARESKDDEFLARDGRVLDDAQRASVRGLAGGLSADRTARAVQQLRGVHPHRRFDVQPARQVAEGHAPSCRGGGRSRRSTTCSPRTSGSRTTTASRTRTRASSTTWSTRRPTSCASTCRPTPTACCRSSTIACAAATTSTWWSPASTPCRNG